MLSPRLSRRSLMMMMVMMTTMKVKSFEVTIGDAIEISSKGEEPFVGTLESFDRTKKEFRVSEAWELPVQSVICERQNPRRRRLLLWSMDGRT